MLVSLNVAQIVQSVTTAHDAQQIIAGLQRKLDTWNKMSKGEIPEHIRELAKENRIAAIKELRNVQGLTLAMACDAIREMLCE